MVQNKENWSIIKLQEMTGEFHMSSTRPTKKLATSPIPPVIMSMRQTSNAS